MKVVVLGGGVIGVTSAYFLARQGHDVTVIERQNGVALETSFANAGQVSPGYASPWAAPSVPRKALRWLLMRHAPLIVRLTLDPFMYGWMTQMLRNCTSARYGVNKARMVRLAEYSRDVLAALRAETGIAYDAGTGGTLQLFRTAKQLDDAGKDIAVLKDYGVAHRLLDRAGCEAAEPGLRTSSVAIAGGLQLPDDETGDCFAFTNGLADRARELGVVFHFGVAARGVEVSDGRASGVETDVGRVAADAVVLALGTMSRALGASVGLRLPIYPVKGYSITAPVLREERAPVSTVLDETYKIALTRLGRRIRVGGMAELSGYRLTLPERRRETLATTLEALFPGAGAVGEASYWSGMRPMTPDGTPVVGRSAIANLYVNAGHGTLGWTMACGSARVIADLVSGKRPEIDVSDLGPERYV